uniref:Uncharacterized protein n=1 Tax=Setaria viridis TaxID=4556 RepID=A0A4U6TMJ0_SETVI|nr:hypothetical protein SEVIR_9G574600v2 [Setaria viridis]
MYTYGILIPLTYKNASSSSSCPGLKIEQRSSWLFISCAAGWAPTAPLSWTRKNLAAASNETSSSAACTCNCWRRGGRSPRSAAAATRPPPPLRLEFAGHGRGGLSSALLRRAQGQRRGTGRGLRREVAAEFEQRDVLVCQSLYSRHDPGLKVKNVS